MKVFLLVMYFTASGAANVFAVGPFPNVQECEAKRAEVIKEMPLRHIAYELGMGCIKVSAERTKL